MYTYTNIHTHTHTHTSTLKNPHNESDMPQLLLIHMCGMTHSCVWRDSLISMT